MSENADIIRRVYALMLAGDVQRVADSVDTNAEWAGREWRVEAEELIPAGNDRVLSVIRVSIRGRGSGVPVEQRLYTVCGIRDGKIALIHDFRDRTEALEAVGLRE